MCAVHTFVTEVFRKLVNAVKTTNNQAFKVKFVGDAQVQGYVEGIMVGYKRTCCRPTRNTLQYRRFNLHIAMRVKVGTHGIVYTCTLYKNIFYTVVHNKVNIAAAIAQFGVVKSIVCNTVLNFYNG